MIFAASVLITACGGGGAGASGGNGGSTTTNTPPPPVAPTIPAPTTDTVAPAGQTLTLTYIDLKAGDMLANTKSSATLASNAIDKLGIFFAYAMKPLISEAYAQSSASSYKSTITAQSFPASRKIVGGKLVSLNPVVKYFEKDSNGNKVEKKIECNFSNAEVSVKSAYVMNQATNDLLVKLDVPDKVNSDCSLSYRNAIFLVYANGDTFEVSSSFPNGIANIIPANDPGFNSSNTPLIVDQNNVRAAEIQTDGSLKLIELTAAGAPLEANASYGYSPGSLSYNGTYLFGTTSQATASKATFLLYEKGSTAFRIFKPGTEWNTNYYLSTILDDNGNYLFHYASGEFYKLNTTDLSFAPLLPQLPAGTPGDPTTTPIAPAFPQGMYGAVGRFEKWLMSDRGVIWNYATKETKCLVLYKNGAYPDCRPISSSPAYTRLFSNYGYTVDSDKAIYVRHDFRTGKTVSVNMTELGYLPKDFIVYKDTAMVEVINSANSDRKYVEVDFNTGLVSDRGVISQGTRQVDTFIKIGDGHN